MTKKITQIRYDRATMEPIVEEDRTEVEILPELKKLENRTKKKWHKTEARETTDNDSVTIVILCWNNLKYTKICTESIKKHTRQPHQIITVDQGSNDGTLKFLKDTLTGDRDLIICNRINKGFSKGNNQALKLAECKYVLVLNNDCEIQKDNWLNLMIDANRNAGLIGAACMKVKPNYKRETFEFVGPCKEEDEWSYIEGWCLFAKRDVWLDFGGFDEQFNPAYSEDSDLSFRMKKCGIGIKAISVPIKHFGGKSAKMIDDSFGAQSIKNNRLLYKKWIGDARKTKGVQKEEEYKRVNRTAETRKPSILIKRKGANGDVLMVTPIIRALKKKYPNSFVTYETQCPDILTNNPHIDHVTQHIPKPDDYDIVLNPRYEDSPGENAIDVMAKQCGVKLEDRKMEISLTADQIRWAKNKMDMTKRYIAFHTGRTWKSREWPFDRFQKVAQHFLAKGYDLVELGDRQTLYMGLGNDCRGCSIKQTAALIRESIAFVGIDSVCANIAKAVKTPAFIIYGCVDPSTRNADAVEYPIWIDELECKGCRGRTSAEHVECKMSEIYCLTKVKPDMVSKAIEEHITEHIFRSK